MKGNELILGGEAIQPKIAAAEGSNPSPTTNLFQNTDQRFDPIFSGLEPLLRGSVLCALGRWHALLRQSRMLLVGMRTSSA
jgi:hypothetical protein